MWPEQGRDGEAIGLTPRPRTARNGRMRGAPSRLVAEVTMRDFMAITKALADENRVRMLLALQGQELCLCQIIELVDLAPSTVSKHMSILRHSRLVEGRKSGRWMYYCLAGADASPTVRQALPWVFRSLASDPQVIQDAARLQEILKLDPQELCERRCAAPSKHGRSRKQGA